MEETQNISQENKSLSTSPVSSTGQALSEREEKEKSPSVPLSERGKRMPIWKKIVWVVAVIIVVLIAVQIVNASKYKMVVNVKEGENIMGVNPLADKLDFGDLSRNNGMTRYVTMKSGGNTATYVMIWKFGNISDLVTIDKNYFVLKPGEEVKLAFEIKIPPSAEIKQYSGWAIVFRIPKIF